MNPETGAKPLKPGGPKNRRIWVALTALLVLYALGGFFLVPALLKKQVVDTFRQDLAREANLKKIHFNPFQLTLKAEGFELRDTDGVTLANFDRFFVNLQVSGLFKWTWTFREISLDGLDLLIERFESGDSRIGRLLADFEASRERPEQGPGPERDEGLPRLLIHDLNFREGSLHFRDHVPADPVTLDVGPVTVSIQELNTLPDRFGQQTVAIRFPGDAVLEWQGNIDLGPFQSSGALAFRNFQLNPAIAYIKALLPLDSLDATLAIHTRYQIDGLADGSWRIALDELQVELAEVAVSGLSPSTEIVSLSQLSLSEGQLRYPEKTLAFNAATIEQPAVTAWLDENRQLSFQQLGRAADMPDENDDAALSPGEPWSLDIEQLQLADGKARFSDFGLSTDELITLSGLQFSAQGISNQPGRNIPVRLSGRSNQGGAFELEGDVIALPAVSFDATASLTDLPLVVAQPYLEQLSAMSMESGLLGAQLELSMGPDKPLGLAGSTSITDLAVRDTRSDESLLAWQQLDIDRFEWTAGGNNIQLSLLTFDQPYGRFRINEDLSTNLSGLFSGGQKPQEAADSGTGSRPAVVVGGISVSNGTFDFSDLSLPLQFATNISDMDGTISTIDTTSAEPANIRLEGQVDEFGLARIEGAMAVFDPIANTDVSVEFKNLLMSNLSPYTVKFAGREIDEGKLDLDLGYSIKQGSLDAQNTIVLSDLVLGDEVESPGATSLPLDLAVALLKDTEGVIRLDLPVTGDVNNPEFEISGVVMQAIANLLTKIVSAPFRMLGSLIGLDSEDLGRFQFLAGRSDLTPPELEKIQQLQTALQQRPELKVEITGPYDPDIDIAKLQYFRLRDEALSRLGQQATDQDEEIEMLDDEIRSVLENLFEERFPDIPLKSVKDRHLTDSGLDQLAYAGDMWNQLLASESITQADLEALATARADAIRTAFLAGGEFSADRISLAAPAQAESGDGEWVTTELGVATD
jgi:hypothetical protein